MTNCCIYTIYADEDQDKCYKAICFKYGFCCYIDLQAQDAPNYDLTYDNDNIIQSGEPLPLTLHAADWAGVHISQRAAGSCYWCNNCNGWILLIIRQLDLFPC